MSLSSANVTVLDQHVIFPGRSLCCKTELSRQFSFVVIRTATVILPPSGCLFLSECVSLLSVGRFVLVTTAVTFI